MVGLLTNQKKVGDVLAYASTGSVDKEKEKKTEMTATTSKASGAPPPDKKRLRSPLKAPDKAPAKAASLKPRQPSSPPPRELLKQGVWKDEKDEDYKTCHSCGSPYHLKTTCPMNVRVENETRREALIEVLERTEGEPQRQSIIARAEKDDMAEKWSEEATKRHDAKRQRRTSWTRAEWQKWHADQARNEEIDSKDI